MARAGAALTPATSRPTLALVLGFVATVAYADMAGQIALNAGDFGFVAGQNNVPVVVPSQQGHAVTIPTNIGGGVGKGGGGSATRSSRWTATPRGYVEAFLLP